MLCSVHICVISPFLKNLCSKDLVAFTIRNSGPEKNLVPIWKIIKSCTLFCIRLKHLRDRDSKQEVYLKL